MTSSSRPRRLSARTLALLAIGAVLVIGAGAVALTTDNEPKQPVITNLVVTPQQSADCMRPVEANPATRVTVASAVRNGSRVAVIIRICPPTGASLTGVNASAELFDREEEQGRMTFAKMQVEALTVPPSGAQLIATVPIAEVDTDQPLVVGLGVFGPKRPDGSWGDLISNYPLTQVK